jgi:hypothetical protein
MNISLRNAFALSLVLVALPAGAVDVRGRVNFSSPAGTIPMARALVELCVAGDSCQQYVTGYDGMYYFKANPGPHVVKVNKTERAQVVIPNTPQFDINPIQGN